MPTVTLSTGVITDATRAAGLDGDGRAPESSVGIWPGTTNDLGNNDLASGVTGWSVTNGTALVSANAGNPGADDGLALSVVASGTSQVSVLNDLVTAAGAGERAVSVWVYAAPASPVIGKKVQLHLREHGGATASAIVTQYSHPTLGTGGFPLVAGWNRLTATGSVVQSDRTFLRFQVNLLSPSLGDEVFVAWGQVERTPLPTPYTASTRADGRAQLPTAGLSPNRGWWSGAIRLPFASNNPPSASVALARWAGGTDDDVLELVYEEPNLVLRRSTADGSDEASRATIFAADTELTITARWTPARVSLSVDGAGFVSGVDAEFADDFERPDQAELGTAPTGQEWIQQGSGSAEIVDGRYLGTGNLYRQINLTAPPAQMRGSFSFDGTTGIQAAAVFIQSPDGVQQGPGLAFHTMLHVVVGIAAYTVDLYDGASFVTILSGNWPNIAGVTALEGDLYNLKRDGTVYDATLTFDPETTALHLLLKQGATAIRDRVLVDARMADYLGPYTTWQLFRGPGDTTPRFEAVAADVSVTADVDAAHIPTGMAATLDVGSADGTTGFLHGEVLWIAAGRGSLTDDDVSALADLDSDPDARSVPASVALPHLVWPADTTALWTYAAAESSATAALSRPASTTAALARPASTTTETI